MSVTGGSVKGLDIKDLISTQELVLEMIKKMKENYGKDSKTRKTKHYIKLKITALNEKWRTFTETHKEIMREYTSEDARLKYFKNNTYGEAEDVFIDLLSEMEQYEETTFGVNTTNPTTTGNQNTEPTRTVPKLPAIQLPKFSGDYKTWTSFHDLFVTLIHNNQNIPNVQKLYHLKSNLTDEAEQLLRHVTVTDANYQTAWEILKQRYENKRVLVNSQIQRLFNQGNIVCENSDNIKNLFDTTTDCLMALENLGINVKSWDPLIIYLIAKRLPMETLQLWEHSISDMKELPTFECMKNFLEARFRALEMIGTTKRCVKEQKQKEHVSHSKSFHSTSQNKCCLCNGQHNIRQCAKFEQMDVPTRFSIANNNELCMNCLTKGHEARKCYSTRNCKICGKRHHHLLHEKRNNNIKPIKKPGRAVNTNNNRTDRSPSPAKSTASLHCSISTNILLATALIKVNSPNGTHILRALLDQGSQTSFITEAAVQLLRLPKQKILATITGIGHNLKETCQSKVQFEVNPTKENKSINIEALVLKNITKWIPNTRIRSQSWPHLEGITLADPNFLQPGKIDLLLGADTYADILLTGLKKGPPNTPVAQNTIFGWIISGKTISCNEEPRDRIQVTNLHSRIELDNILKNFWEIEEVPIPKYLTAEDIQSEEIFVKTHSRDSQGRYIVKLPFKEGMEHSSIGKSRHIAMARFGQLERRFKTDPKLKEEYHKCLNEYIYLNHMKTVDPPGKGLYTNTKNKDRSSYYYLPHHPVIKEESSTTKLRVVFNASQPTDNGRSINDMLLTGPTIQDELKAILIRWRLLQFVYSADIEKMYRQIKIHKDHQNFQRILWRGTANEDIQDFVLSRVTFGFTSAAFLAVRSLKQLALDEGEKFPLASNILENDFYVDNVLSGADSIQEAKKQSMQLMSLLQSGGFPLRKWSTNHDDIIADIPDEYKEVLLYKDIGIEDNIKTLGLNWNPKEDTFTYKISLGTLEHCVTKRIVASIVAKIFDPIGWCAPVIIVGKILLQSLWLIELDWDTELPPNIVNQFIGYQKSLQEINRIKIPRWIGTYFNSSFEIHGFCDASNKAYSAVIYIKLLDNERDQKTFLLTASTRVAPIKSISIPRLELCGALLLARIYKYTIAAMKTKPSAVYSWTDSSIVLSWLNGHPNKWNCFVANRITEIKNLMIGTTWKHVPSEDNPADCASRGLTPEELNTHDIWWSGPKWLQQTKNEWPKNLIRETNEELRSIKSLTTQVYTLPSFIMKFSTLKKLIRVTAYIFRFIAKCRKNINYRTTVWLAPSELDSAFNFLVRKNQELEFAEEMKALKEKRNIRTSSRLIKLHPFLDKNGLLRVGGRIEESNIPYEGKHPIILNDKGLFTEIIIRHIHIETLHGGPQLTLNIIRQRFWILNARNSVRYLINKCIICLRQKESSEKQLMGSLPTARITQSRPFSHTGIDYCGPFSIRLSKGRGTKSQKCYVAIFVCMAVKAIHIELVSDLTTQSFLAALRRFVSRRGIPSDIYSDCGTNFIGASRILDKDLQQSLTQVQDEVAAIIANEAISWHFNPPAAPNFGGLWEAGVKSTKYHLKRLINDRLLTFEEMVTLLTQIEGILNSRPISAFTNDIEDLTALTPGHFLIGAPIKSIPEPSLINVKENNLTRWHLVQQMNQHFWKRWHQEYLHLLQQRQKWNQTKDNIITGDLVIIKDSNLPPNKWLLGRIIMTYPGSDQLTRVMDIKTKNGILKRPISKVCKLPIEKH